MLPGFPLHYWCLAGFMTIANSLGRFILMEEDHILAYDRRIPFMLMEMDALEDLLEEMEVV